MKKMKNKFELLVFSIVLTLVSSVSVFAQIVDPGSPEGGATGTGDPTGGDPVAPINDSIWILVLVGLVYVVLKFRAAQKLNRA